MKVLARSSVLVFAVAASAPVQAQQCEQRLQASDASMADRFGTSVALDGDTMLVGASSAQQSNSGAAYVFERMPTGWVETWEFIAPSTRAFGASVAIEGNTAVIGDLANGTQGSLAGAVYVFERRATGWQPPEQLLASNGGYLDRFGTSVSVSGDTIVIGAPGASPNGSAYVFERTPNGWVETQELLASDPANGSFGVSVAIELDTILIGDNTHTNYAGAAYVFERTPNGWVETQELLASDGRGDDYFGSVSLHGDQAVVGAPQGPGFPGSAYVFERTPNGWVETHKLLASDGASEDWFGASVSISGTNVVVGAPGRHDLSGAAYIFERTATQWVQTHKLLASDGEMDNIYGASVTIQPGRAVVGAPWACCVGPDPSHPGAVYAVDLPCVISRNYCNPAIPNSTGLPGIILATGSDLVIQNNVALTADQLPPGQFGYFLTSQTQGFFNPPGSIGFICLGGDIGRFNQPGNVGQGPTFTIQVDLTSMPVNPPVAVQPGDTWNFQAWYRDTIGGLPTSNFTDAASILFLAAL